MELLEEAGLTLHEVLVAATRTPAEMLGVSADIGTIEVGKRADLIICDTASLDRAGALRSLKWVIKVWSGQDTCSVDEALKDKQTPTSMAAYNYQIERPWPFPSCMNGAAMKLCSLSGSAVLVPNDWPRPSSGLLNKPPRGCPSSILVSS